MSFCAQEIRGRGTVKRVLVIYFSQTGQLRRVAESLCGPLAADPAVELEWCELQPAQPYPFPWPFFQFFDQFPEAVGLVPPALKATGLASGLRYDLVIVAYTVWYLSPAPPITAFLKSEQGRAILADTPVITVIACRNMWLMAQEKTKMLLAGVGARLSDNVVLTDKGSALATFVTTPRWMLTGRTDRLWGIFPKPGIAEDEIRACKRFGHAIASALHEGRLDGRQPVLGGLQAVTVDDRLIASERIATRSFHAWGALIRLTGPQGTSIRRLALLVYVLFLIAMIVTVVPLTMLLRPLLAGRLQRARAYFELPSGSGGERMAVHLP